MCRPFRVHLHMELPPPPPPDAENDLDKCIAYYSAFDTDKDGTPDWTALIDGSISDVLYPNDDDMDGDGVTNILDPDPLNPKVSKGARGANGLPVHLAMEGKAGEVQADLYKKFGVLAIDHTDKHSAEVLEALLLVMKKGLPLNALKSVKSLKYVYAFKGHDPQVNIAAYHRQAKAISIGGVTSYGDGELSQVIKIKVIAAFAHELGHAFLFDRMSAGELRDIGTRYGQWKITADDPSTNDLHSHWFFQSHPLQRLAKMGRLSATESQTFIRKDLWKSLNFTSQYATTNLHEWFAESFAARILKNLGESGSLGESWREKLVRLPEHSNGYWVNYNNLSDDFSRWIETRISAIPAPDAGPKTMHLQKKTHD